MLKAIPYVLIYIYIYRERERESTLLVRGSVNYTFLISKS